MIDLIYTIDKEKGNCHIVDSYKITDRKTMEDFVKENLSGEPFNCRSIKSYVREWRAHNLLYKWKIKIESSKDVDLDINESKWRRFCYFILSLLYNEKQQKFHCI